MQRKTFHLPGRPPRDGSSAKKGTPARLYGKRRDERSRGPPLSRARRNRQVLRRKTQLRTFTRCPLLEDTLMQQARLSGVGGDSGIVRRGDFSFLFDKEKLQ